MASRYNKFLNRISMEDGSVEEAVIEAEESAKAVDEAVENDEGSNLENETVEAPKEEVEESADDTSNESEGDTTDAFDEQAESNETEEDSSESKDETVQQPIESVEQALESLHEKVNQVSDAFDATNKLEELSKDVKNVLVEDGGLTQQTAKLVETSIESILNAAGLSRIKRPSLPSLECFGGRSSRSASTEVALESVASIINTIKNGIKKAIKVIVDFINKLFNKIMGYFKNDIVNLIGLRQTLQKLDDDQIKSVTIRNPEKINKYLSINRQPISSVSILGGLTTLRSMFDRIIKQVSLEEDIAAILADFENFDKTTIDSVMQKLSMVRILNMTVSPDVGGKIRVGETETLLGEVAVYSILSAEDVGASIRYMLAPKTAKKEVLNSKGNRIEVLDYGKEPFESFSKAEMLSLIDAGLELAEQAEIMKKVTQDRSGFVGQVKKVVEAHIENFEVLAQSVETQEERELLVRKIKFCQTVVNTIGEPMASLALHSLKVIDALIKTIATPISHEL